MTVRRLLIALAAGGLGAVALAGCGGTTLQLQPAAATTTSTSGGPAASDPALLACDTSAWRGAISPEGRPDNLDAGDAGAVYVWHDAGGWHVRATDMRKTDHHYTGTIHLAPAGARFADVRPVRDEQDDKVTVDADNTLHYDFHTYASIDGVDFRASCSDPSKHERERLAFHTEFDGHPISDRVRIGDSKQSPKSADFAFVRSV